MAEKPRALPRMMIDADAALGKAVDRARDKPMPPEGASLGELDEALRDAHRLYTMLRDCEGPDRALGSLSRRVSALARRRADHPDADEARPRALALEIASRTARERGQTQAAEALSREAAERWLEAADDERAQAKEFLFRATDAFLAGERFDRAAGAYARAVKIGEDPWEASRVLQPTRGAHRLKLVLLLMAAGKAAEARAINDALVTDFTQGFERKVSREEFEPGLDRARALAEAHAVAGNLVGERQARLGAIDLALALAKREAKAGTDPEAALRWADAAQTESLKARDDRLFLDTFRRGARALLEGALAALEADAPKERRASSVRLLFDAGRRFRLLGEASAADDCYRRAYEVSPRYSPADRRPVDELAMALYLVKAPTPEADQAEVHLKNAQAFVKGLVTAAGVGEDHPSARLRHLALKEAFYRRVGDLRRHAEVVEIMEVAAAEGAALALEKAAVKFNSGSFADARGLLDEAVIYLEHAGPHGASDLLRQAYRARSLCFHLDPTGDLPETWAEASRRKAAAFDPKALGYDWRRIEAALLAMDPPAEFTTVNDTLQFIKGRAPKPSAGSP